MHIIPHSLQFWVKCVCYFVARVDTLDPHLLGFTPVVGSSPVSFWCWAMNFGVLRCFETSTNSPLVREEYSPPLPPLSPSLSSDEASSAKGRSSSSSCSSVAPDL